MENKKISFKEIFEYWETAYNRHLTIEEKVLIMTSHEIGFSKGFDESKEVLKGVL